MLIRNLTIGANELSVYLQKPRVFVCSVIYWPSKYSNQQCYNPVKPSIIDCARKYIAKSPPAISGQGGHNKTFHIAAVLVHGFALGEADALTLLREFNQRCSPAWSEGDLIHKIKSAANTVHLQPCGYLLGDRVNFGQKLETRGQGPVLPPKPKFQKTVLARVAHKVGDVKDVVSFLAERSRVPLDELDSASVLRHLYPHGSGEKVLIFTDMKSQGQFLWEADRGDSIQQRHFPAGNEGVWFLPQPVNGGFFPNPRSDGNLSRRSEEAVTAWRYAVLESDEADADEWLRCLVQIPLRIACVCESGKRSIHALVRLDAASKADWDRLMAPLKPLMITLGADRGALTAVRLSRLPQAMRGVRCQRLLYLNPQPSGVPICQQPPQPVLYLQKVRAKGNLP